MRKLLSDLIFDLRKCPTWKTHESETACFLIWALPEVQNWIQKQFSHKVLYNFLTNIFGALWSTIKKTQK